MVDGVIERAEYGRLLTHLLEVHETMETYVLPRLPLDVLDAGMISSPAIRADLAALGLEPVPYTKAEQGLYTRYKDLLADATPAALVGAVYVLECARFGSTILHRPLSVALGVEAVPGQGLDYHIDGLAGASMRFESMRVKVDQALSDPAQAEAAAEMARATVALLYRLYQSVSVPRLTN